MNNLLSNILFKNCDKGQLVLNKKHHMKVDPVVSQPFYSVVGFRPIHSSQNFKSRVADFKLDFLN